MGIGAITYQRADTNASVALQNLRAQGLANPEAVRNQLKPDEFGRVWAGHAQFEAAKNKHGSAQVVGLWCQHNRSGLPRFRWHGPGDAETFFMTVKVTNGDWHAVVPQLWTNLNHGLHPEDYEGRPMEFAYQNGDLVTFKAQVPIDKTGNFRVTGRISTSGDAANPNWQWASNSGVGDIRFRPRAVEDENISEMIVPVALVNSDGNAISTLRDLMDPTPGKYNLWAIKAAGKNAIRVAVLRADRWDRANPFDTLGSPYAPTDLFSIDPRLSKDLQTAGVPAWDVDRQRQIANAEFWALCDKAHELGMKVIMDVALNHAGHNFTFRDLFDDPGVGEHVVRNNFDQVVVNDGQRNAVAARVKSNSYGTAEQLFPEMYVNKNWADPTGAHSINDMMAGGNGEWQDTKQWNHGSLNWGTIETHDPMNQSVTDWFTRVMYYWTNPPYNDVGAPKHPKRGADGFRVDHSSNMPTKFWERSTTQLQALVDKPIAFVDEDFNQADKLRVYADAMESGGYKDLIAKFKASDIPGVQGIINSDYFFETLRGGNHDEVRVSTLFDNDLMASGRYQCMLDLMGGISTSVAGDEFGEGRKLEFKRQGAVPPVLLQAHNNQLSPANIDLQLALGRAGRAQNDDPSLHTILREPLYAAGPETSILGIARHADDRAIPGTLVFCNLANGSTLQNKFWLDGETRSRIDPNGWYQARDQMSKTPMNNIWGGSIKGSDLLSNGVFVKLAPYQIQALKIERVG